MPEESLGDLVSASTGWSTGTDQLGMDHIVEDNLGQLVVTALVDDLSQ